MSSMDRLDFLRERNKDLLKQLQRQREKLERLCGYSQSRKMEKEDGTEERKEPAEIVTLTHGDRGSAKAALSKPTVRFAATCEEQTGIKDIIPRPPLASKHKGGSAECTTPSDILKDTDRQVHSRLQDMTPATTSCVGDHRKEHTEVQTRVTFQSDDCDERSASDRHHLQCLLGYDWIAGVLDAEDSLIERSDEFFNDLRVFRSLNKDECVHGPQADFVEENHSTLPLLTDKDRPEAHLDAHQCTFSYRINSRLFPVPLHSQECCPVCKKHKSSHPHTAAEPALIRVSIPRSALLPPYRYKAHRRGSFDPSDSLGLPSHCLSGWSNSSQSTLPPPSCLDLRSSLNVRSSTGSQNKELEDLSVPKVSDNQNTVPVPDVSRLVRHNFQHFSLKRKLRSSSYPLH